MKKVINRNQIFKVLNISVVLFLLFSLSAIAQDDAGASAGDAVKGKALFNQNCAACHSLTRKMTGPALQNVETRLRRMKG